MHASRTLRFGLVLLAAACSSKTYLMPTPNIYADPAWNPFAEVPAVLKSDSVSVLYVTDRAPDEEHTYGVGRSRSAAFGEAVVQIGDGLSWEQLVAASRTGKRAQKLELRMTSVREQARFGETPPRLALTDAQLAAGGPAPADPAHVEAERLFREELVSRLAKTPRKEVFLYVHGFNNSFEDAVMTTAEVWHFLGREGVPVCYTWPAGMGGFKGYEYTLASTQFTVFHLKQTLRLLASSPEVEKVHLLAHSRGTAVTTEAVRELHLEIRGTADTQKTLKLGSVVLAAADIDLDVAIARNATERIARAVERSAVYISEEDSALGLSNWLFGGKRLGEIDFKIFDKSEIKALRNSRRLQLIDARVRKRGLGHSYFHQDPSASSDVILFLRYQLAPGGEHGRPLGVSDLGIWVVDDGYPGADWKPPGGK
ncbi:MAG: alpha/beta hydrolase [Planctomycetota bacterium]|jgi:esterase/lipase superfamily enzyme